MSFRFSIQFQAVVQFCICVGISVYLSFSLSLPFFICHENCDVHSTNITNAFPLEHPLSNVFLWLLPSFLSFFFVYGSRFVKIDKSGIYLNRFRNLKCIKKDDYLIVVNFLKLSASGLWGNIEHLLIWIEYYLLVISCDSPFSRFISYEISAMNRADDLSRIFNLFLKFHLWINVSLCTFVHQMFAWCFQSVCVFCKFPCRYFNCRIIYG